MSPNSGAWQVRLPWVPFPLRICRDDWGRGVGACWPEGLAVGCSGTPRVFLVTRGHHSFPSRMWLCPRYRQLGVLLAKGVMDSLAFYTWFRGTRSQVTPPLPLWKIVHRGRPHALSSEEKAG